MEFENKTDCIMTAYSSKEDNQMLSNKHKKVFGREC